jgi:PhoPQ-activated pathogenicity-related protein
MMKIVDPDAYLERLAAIPKYIIVASDDEFMSIDWTQLYYDEL